jgi:hypothetical protein
MKFSTNQCLLAQSPHNKVPFEEEQDHYFLKTVIPSRKATRDYLHKGEPDVDI